MATRGNALVVMTKAPRPGESKTRLVPPLTLEEAAALARALLIDQLDHLAKFRGAELFIAYTPIEAAPLVHALAPKPFSCFPQAGKDLGARMQEVFRYLFAAGFESVVLIGSDLPPIAAQTFDAAYAALSAGRDVVLGPTMDGGYYLVGMSRLVADIFAGIRWSRADVLDRTLEKIRGAGLSWELLQLCQDIDTPEDLVRLYRHRDALPMKNTLTVLQELKERGTLLGAS
jgi:rSAM/selenodomain-associated transferase 1